MKQRFLAILFLLSGLFSCFDAAAESFMDRVHFEITTGSGSKSKGLTPLDFAFKGCIDVIPVMYAFATVEENVSLYKDNDIKTYYTGTSLGGGLGVKLLNSIPDNPALDLRAKVLTSVGGTSWKRTTYDAALALYMKARRISPLLELGYRHLDSRSKGFDNTSHFYASVGLIF